MVNLDFVEKQQNPIANNNNIIVVLGKMEATITTSSNSSSIPANHMMHAGSFTGHVVPGTIFLLMSLCSSIHVYNHYYSARIRGGKSKS